MLQGNNDIGTVISERKLTLSMNNDNVEGIEKAKQVDVIADKLVEGLGNSDWRPYYCKVAYALPESRIWDNYEKAMKAKKSSGGLFHFLCNKDMHRG